MNGSPCTALGYRVRRAVVEVALLAPVVGVDSPHAAVVLPEGPDVAPGGDRGPAPVQKRRGRGGQGLQEAAQEARHHQTKAMLNGVAFFIILIHEGFFVDKFLGGVLAKRESKESADVNAKMRKPFVSLPHLLV